MKNSRVRALSAIGLVITDAVLIAVAFLIAYGIRWESAQADPSINLGDLSAYFGLLIVQIIAIITVMFWAQLYHQARAVSRVDEFYAVFGAVSIGMMMSVAVSTLLFKSLEFDFPRVLIIYAWLLTIVLVMIGRLIYHAVQWRLQARGIGRDKVLIVGTGDIGRLVLEKIKGSPHLGYEVIGFVHQSAEPRSAPCAGRPRAGQLRRSAAPHRRATHRRSDHRAAGSVGRRNAGPDLQMLQGVAQHQGLPRRFPDHRHAGDHRRSGRAAAVERARCAAARLAR